ncbi:MFS transporter, partial [Paraburkholderia piptadeniae]
ISRIFFPSTSEFASLMLTFAVFGAGCLMRPLGAIVLGWLMDRVNPHLVLAASYTLAGLFIAAIGNLTATPWLAALAVFGAGFCVSGSQVGANALSAAFYPTDCRATGVSWANGVGRSGSVVGSIAGGAMLTAGMTMPALFMTVGVPAVIAGVSMLMFGLFRGSQSHAGPATPLIERTASR